MPNDEACLQIDDLLADVGRMIGDSLNRLGDPEKSKRECNGNRLIFHIRLRGLEQFTLELRNGVIEEEYLLREVRVSGCERAVCVAEHADDAVRHHAKDRGHAHRSGLVLEDMLGYLDRAIGDPFELIVHFDDREYRANAELIVHPDSQERHRLPLDFHINAVNFLIASDDGEGLFAIAVEVTLDCTECERKDAFALFIDGLAQGFEAFVEGRQVALLWGV